MTSSASQYQPVHELLCHPNYNLIMNSDFILSSFNRANSHLPILKTPHSSPAQANRVYFSRQGHFTKENRCRLRWMCCILLNKHHQSSGVRLQVAAAADADRSKPLCCVCRSHSIMERRCTHCARTQWSLFFSAMPTTTTLKNSTSTSSD